MQAALQSQNSITWKKSSKARPQYNFLVWNTLSPNDDQISYARIPIEPVVHHLWIGACTRMPPLEFIFQKLRVRKVKSKLYGQEFFHPISLTFPYFHGRHIHFCRHSQKEKHEMKSAKVNRWERLLLKHVFILVYWLKYALLKGKSKKSWPGRAVLPTAYFRQAVG